MTVVWGQTSPDGGRLLQVVLLKCLVQREGTEEEGGISFAPVDFFFPCAEDTMNLQLDFILSSPLTRVSP